MADPKYANLPGIAHDQPDVYETGDLPESEQHYDDEDAEQVSIVLIMTPCNIFKNFSRNLLY